MLLQSLCIISKPSLNLKWSCSAGTPISRKNGKCLYHATFKFDGWLWIGIWHLFYDISGFVLHVIAICELWSGNARIGAKFIVTSFNLTFDLWPWPFAWTSLLSSLITSEILWLFDYRNVAKIVRDIQTEGQTYGHMERTVHRGAWLQLKSTECRSWQLL